MGNPCNLPLQLTSFVGREREIAEVKCLLSSSRLLTLTGAGGSGKTRLALQVAIALLDVFADGAWLIELAALSDPVRVPQAVTGIFGIRESAQVALVDTLVEYLRARQLLILLDNCEHLIQACALLVGRLLRACPNLRILTTSREALGVPGETSFRVPSLTLPDPQQIPSADDLFRFEAIRLFADRATASTPDFQLSDTNAKYVAQICARLDGMPLAIELAASRVKNLTVQQIAAHLDDRFRLLSTGP